MTSPSRADQIVWHPSSPSGDDDRHPAGARRSDDYTGCGAADSARGDAERLRTAVPAAVGESVTGRTVIRARLPSSWKGRPPVKEVEPRFAGPGPPFRSPTAAAGNAGAVSRSPRATADSRSAGCSQSSMRLAIFSDVHGQVGRLSACLEAIARTGADELWCLGDAIDGLSAREPELTVACVRAINEVCAVKLVGNHEAWALQDQSLPGAAAALIECWSVAAQRDGILAVHGSPRNPLMGRLSDERSVREALRWLPGWLCAYGHTHQAALWIGHTDGTIERQRRPRSQRLGRSMRAVASPGALSGPNPSWLLVDTVRRRLTWHLDRHQADQRGIE